MALPPLLLADIGGTNARFALYTDDRRIIEERQWLTSLYPSLGDAIAAYRSEVDASTLGGAAICAAGPLEGERIKMTNCPWTVSRAEIGAAAGVHDPVLANDFTAQAMGVIAVETAHLRAIGGGAGQPGQAIGVLGPGTGLGVSGLIPNGRGGHIPLAGEGGHVDLAPQTEREIAIVYQLMRQIGHVSAEDLLCGPGLETLYVTLAELDGVGLKARPVAAHISQGARDGNPLAVEATQLFTRWLGAVAGNLALTLGARSGVYLAGGILPKWGDLFDADLFRRGFEAKGQFADYMKSIPTWIVTGGQPAFLGLAALWRQRAGAEQAERQ